MPDGYGAIPQLTGMMTYGLPMRTGYTYPQSMGQQEATAQSQQQANSAQQAYNQAQSSSFIPDYSEEPLLETFANDAAAMAPQVYQWGMDAYNRNQGNIDNLMQQGQEWASPAHIAVMMGQAEAGVQQAGEQARQASLQDLQSYGIDPSAGRYAALDQASRVQTAAAAAGAGNQQRMSDIQQGITMQNQATSAGLQNTQIGYGAANAMNSLYGTAMQLKYPPLGTTSTSMGASQGTSESSGASTSQSQGYNISMGGGGGGGGGGTPPNINPIYIGPAAGSIPPVAKGGYIDGYGDVEEPDYARGGSVDPIEQSIKRQTGQKNTSNDDDDDSDDDGNADENDDSYQYGGAVRRPRKMRMRMGGKRAGGGGRRSKGLKTPQQQPQKPDTGETEIDRPGPYPGGPGTPGVADTPVDRPQIASPTGGGLPAAAAPFGYGDATSDEEDQGYQMGGHIGPPIAKIYKGVGIPRLRGGGRGGGGGGGDGGASAGGGGTRILSGPPGTGRSAPGFPTDPSGMPDVSGDLARQTQGIEGGMAMVGGYAGGGTVGTDTSGFTPIPTSPAGVMPGPPTQAFEYGGAVPGATSGGFVSKALSPSNGHEVDDIPARLNQGEYVIPRDVVHWQGKDFFHKLITKSREARAKAGAPNDDRGYNLGGGI